MGDPGVSTKLTRDPFRARFKGAVALGQCQNPTECEHIRRLPCGQLLPSGVGEELRYRRSPSPKQKTAASLAVGQHRRPEIAARRSAPAHPAGNARAHTRLSHPSASGFDRLAPNSPHSCAPAPPIESAGRRRRPRAREQTTITKLTRDPFRADSKERSRSANAKIQQSASTSEGCPAASCCPAALAKSSATADLQVPNRKQRRASLSASTGDQKLPRAVRRPHTQPEMPERTHASATLLPADSIGSRRTVPIAARRRRRLNPLAEGAALARASKRPSQS